METIWRFSTNDGTLIQNIKLLQIIGETVQHENNYIFELFSVIMSIWINTYWRIWRTIGVIKWSKTLTRLISQPSHEQRTNLASTFGNITQFSPILENDEQFLRVPTRNGTCCDIWQRHRMITTSHRTLQLNANE